jgi:hypothetical protein
VRSEKTGVGPQVAETGAGRPVLSPSLLTPHSSLLTPLSVWHGVAQIVEGACAVLADPVAGQQIPPDVRTRLLAAIRSITGNLGPDSPN